MTSKKSIYPLRKKFGKKWYHLSATHGIKASKYRGERPALNKRRADAEIKRWHKWGRRARRVKVADGWIVYLGEWTSTRDRQLRSGSYWKPSPCPWRAK